MDRSRKGLVLSQLYGADSSSGERYNKEKTWRGLEVGKKPTNHG